METLQIQFEPKNRNKIIEMLNSFPENEVQIIREDPHFEENKRILHERYQEMQEGKAKFISIEDYEIMLENDLA
jgi:hypothetical protein